MEDLGDYIYLIAIVIAGLSSLLKKKKKSVSEMESRGDGMPDLDDVLPELEDEYRPWKEESSTDPFETVKVPEPVKQPVTVPVSYETVADFMKLRAKKTIHSNNRSSAQPIMEMVEEELEPDISLETVEDVKKAFIYSEIFNRKY